MSIESFLKEHPADVSFPDRVKWETNRSRSPVGFMADILIAEGSRGLNTIAPLLYEAMMGKDEEGIENNRNPYLTNGASIYLGVGINAIERILVEGKFEPGKFTEEITKAYAEANLNPNIIEPGETEVLDADYMRIMARLAKDDKTLAYFFEEGFGILPKGLRYFYDRALPHVRALLPQYKDRVSLLIARNPKRHA